MSLRPASVDPQGGPITGNGGGPMPLAKPTATWSHVTGKRHPKLISLEVPPHSGANRDFGNQNGPRQGGTFRGHAATRSGHNSVDPGLASVSEVAPSLSNVGLTLSRDGARSIEFLANSRTPSAASGNVCAFDQLSQGLVLSVPVPPDDVAADHGVLLFV